MFFWWLDLDLWPIFTKKISKVSWVCRIKCKKKILIVAKLWPVGGVTDKQTDKQTDRQTNGTDQYTLRKCPSGFRKVTNRGDQSTILQSNESRFAKLQVQTWRWWRNDQSLLSDSIIDLDYNMSMSKVKDTVNLVLHQMKSVQWVLSMIKYYYNSGKYVTLTFDMWPWPFCLTLT